ncbi:uncharacterized protein EAF02_002283 [Botrytis sinoallii]|uniref:uncharacterized protein n=1 Tax=Botrytis sinoallii TaxID=1463999 RepID=UPI0019019341|nr:uncharacterized protein EAF02_002283 [Botrytis sinoallii]KAF7889868.1 hypothetical protein EAF02_002283 [Botrytis sinoallii]
MTPRNVEVVGASTLLQNIMTSWESLFNTGGLIAKGYARAHGKPFAVPQQDKYLLVVSSPEQIHELVAEATRKNSRISSQVLGVDLFEPEYTLSAERGESKTHIASNHLKHKITSHLPYAFPEMQQTVQNAFLNEMKGDKITDGWEKVTLYYVANRIAGRMNNVLIFGDELASSTGFYESCMRFITDATILLGILRHIPRIFYRPVSWVVMNYSGARAKFESLVASEIIKRRSESLTEKEKHKDCLQWIMDYSGDAPVDYIARQMLSMTLGGAHQQPMYAAFLLYNLCLHPEYTEKLRAEIRATKEIQFRDLQSGTPYLDSFLREVARLNPLTHVALPRKVMSEFTFLDGTHVPKDNWICVPHEPLMRLSDVYAVPQEFNGFRFVNEDSSGIRSKNRFWDMSREFPFWGNPKTGCPARYYVSMNMKMIAIHLLDNYDFKLFENNAPPKLSYHVLDMPHPKLKALVRRREHIEV